MVQQPEAYPVTITGDLSAPPGRGWWLIKWLLGIPHFIILAFLWIAFIVVWIIVFFAILFTTKFPRGLFNFNVGVMRWTWRVGFYSYEVLGTDKYPPFTLNSVPDYPADLQIAYPEKLSRGLVLIKWWLLAIPHWIIVIIFNGFTFSFTRLGIGGWSFRGVGLTTILAIFAGFVLLFKGNYPEDIFKLCMGMNRWSYRVAGYTSLMTDKYPPFRLWD